MDFDANGFRSVVCAILRFYFGLKWGDNLTLFAFDQKNDQKNGYAYQKDAKEKASVCKTGLNALHRPVI
ncbi:MAG: hypothetical protein WBC90_17755 [Albidovulum sp.]